MIKRKDKIGWSEIVIIMAFIVLAILGYMKRKSLKENIDYAKGIMTGIHKGSKGSIYIDFLFYANGRKVESSMPFSLCKECKIGDTIVLKFDKTDPHNNGFLKVLRKEEQTFN